MRVPTYLTGVSNPTIRAVARRHKIGLLNTPDTHYDAQIDCFPVWAADNACFNHPNDFNLDTFLAWLGSFTPNQRRRCLFAPAPDVVGDAVQTLKRSRPVLPLIRQLGIRAAFVAQDGIEHTVVPWTAFDVLFLGGSTEFKLGPIAAQLCLEARRRGKRIHMGRVNSLKRLRIAQQFGCHTVDGTFLAFGPNINLQRLLKWYRQLPQAA